MKHLFPAATAVLFLFACTTESPNGGSPEEATTPSPEDTTTSAPAETPATPSVKAPTTPETPPKPTDDSGLSEDMRSQLAQVVPVEQVNKSTVAAMGQPILAEQKAVILEAILNAMATAGDVESAKQSAAVTREYFGPLKLVIDRLKTLPSPGEAAMNHQQMREQRLMTRFGQVVQNINNRENLEALRTVANELEIILK